MLKAYRGRLDSFKDGLVAFGFGAAAGAVTAATGAVLASSGTFAGTLSSTAVALATTGIAGGLIHGVGNAAYFGDPYSFKQWATGVLFGGITGGIAKLQGPNANILNGTSDGSKSLFPYHGLAKYVKINVTWSLQFNSARNLTYQGVHQLNSIFGGTLADVAVVGNPVTGRSQRQVGTLLESVDDIFANPSC